MLHTKYQGSRPCGFRQEDFQVFPYISLCKTCNSRIVFGLRGIIRTNLEGRGPLGDATYKKIEALGLMVSDKIFSCYSQYKPM